MLCGQSRYKLYASLCSAFIFKINRVKVDVLFSAYVYICFSLQLEFELILCEENNGGIRTSLVKS
jgi:hypothetical protein